MHSNNSSGSRATLARGFMALFAIVLAMGLGLAARPAAAAPFAYDTNESSQQCLGDRHGRQDGGGDDSGGECAQLDRLHPGRDARLRRE